MYDLINRHAALIVGSLKRERDIDPYVWMIQRLSEIDTTVDLGFQRLYRRYWQLNPARLSPRFCAVYFSLLEKLKRTPDEANVEAVARTLFDTPTHSDGRESLQFSFASKLVHMVRPHLPVYDSTIRQFFFLPSEGSAKLIERRLESLVQSYAFLADEYGRILNKGLLAPAIAVLRGHFSLGYEYADEKAIDTLIWRFVGLLRNGAIRDRIFAYG